MLRSKIFFFLILGLLASCGDSGTDPEEETFTDELSVTIDGTNYSYDEFLVDTEWLESQNRLFIKKEEGDNVFTINFPLDLSIGNNGMNWNNGGVWFRMETADGAFWTLDETTSFMNVIEIDTTARTVSATFEGVGTQAVGTESAMFTNGVLRASY